MHPSSAATLRLAAVPLAMLVLAASASSQRMHRLNPTFGQLDPDAFINGEPPDTSNWPHPAAPDGNPFPRSTAPPADLAYRDAKAQLGKLLFWEEQMSSDNTMACGTCHSIASGGTDFRDGALVAGTGGSFGMIRQHEVSLSRVDYGFVTNPSTDVDRQHTPVHTPTMIGAYVFNIQFWDGRAGPDFPDGAPLPSFLDWAGLEDQGDDPEANSTEMGHENIDWTSTFIQKKLGASFPMALVDPATIPPDVMPWVAANANYARIFDKIFQSDPDPAIAAPQGVSRVRVAMAIATYERTLIPDQAPIDLGTMNQSQINGFTLMRSTGCFGCHSITGGSVGSVTPALTPANTLADPFDNPFSDGDIHDIAIGTGPRKTPTLRNVGLRKRFFSNGSVLTADDLLDKVYDAPGRNPPLGFAGTLTQQQRDEVIGFLFKALTDPRVAQELPPFDRPQLASERPEFSPFETNEFGNGTPGPSGLVPEILANSPPLVLGASSSTLTVNWFKVGVGSAAPNSQSFLLVSNSAGIGPIVWVGPVIQTVTVGPTNNEGFATAHVPFPLSNSTIGVDFFVQWLVDDSGTRSFSNAAKFTPFQF